MLSHDKKFTLFFKSRTKAVLARGEEFNYITDYPQDLYILHNETGKIKPLITYDWFPKKVKKLSLDSKKLSEKKRLLLKDYIEENSIAWSVQFIDHEEIDKTNILKAKKS